jgi:hypothetical protein
VSIDEELVCLCDKIDGGSDIELNLYGKPR